MSRTSPPMPKVMILGDGVASAVARSLVDPRFEVAAERYQPPRPALVGERRPLEVEPGLLVQDLGTVAACDDARLRLVDAINSIEGQLDAATARRASGEAAPNLDWERRARSALRAKQSAMREVQFLRGKFSREEKQAFAESANSILLSVIRETEPEALRRAVDVAKARGLEV